MKLRALITTLALGTSTVAMAQPAYSPGTVQFSRRPIVRDQRPVEGDRDRDFDDDDRDASVYRGPIRQRPVVRLRGGWYTGPRTYRPSWVSLTEPTQIERGRERIDIDPRVGELTQLRLQASAGATFVERVIVRFEDGTRQVADVRQVIDAHHPMVELPLDRDQARIERIIVIGETQPGGAYQIFGI